MPKRMLRDWTDSVPVNRLTANAERLFIRLIMRADDYGCFTANTKLIRSLCFPLLTDRIRESDISRWLAECEQAGLIAFYGSADRPLLAIRNFGQRLKNSRRHYDAPPSDLAFREVPGSSGKFPAEEKRRDVDVEEEEKRGGVAAVPDGLDTPAFRKAWDEWLAYRKGKGKAVSDIAAERQLAKCAKWGAGRSLVAIDTAISNDWQGLFEPKGAKPADPLDDDYEATPEQIKIFSEAGK
jgi:hypothetical protein